MSDTYKFYNGIRFESLSADPSAPVEGQLQYADGTARTKGLWQYDGTTWIQVPLSAGGTTITTVTKTGAYTLLASDQNVLGDATSGAFTLTLPAAASNSGQVYYITKIDSSTNVVTIDANGSETIDGELTLELGGQYNSVQIISDGSNWYNLSKDKYRVAYIKNVQSSGTSGGTITGGSWQTVTLNTLEGDTEFISISSNQITLEPGVYNIDAEVPLMDSTLQAKAKLYNITGTSDEIIGSSIYSSGAGSSLETMESVIRGRVVITASTTFEIRARTVNNGTYGFSSSFSVDEVYTQITIEKVN